MPYPECQPGGVLVRREGPQDRDAVEVVHTAAFGGSGLAEVPEARLVRELRRDGDVPPATALVAVVGERVVGHVVCSRGHVQDRGLLGLGPLGVLPDYQRRGVGSALMHAVVAAADALDEPAVVLLGDPAFYGRFGFVLAEPLGLLPPVPAWTAHFQVRPLTAWDGAVLGSYRYAAAFDRL